MSADCQVCGKPAAGEGTVEGANVPLCEDCSSYASNFSFYREFLDSVRDKQFSKRPPQLSPKPSGGKGFGEFELVEDYGKKIMQAREKQGLNRKTLARKIMIQEKELEGFEQQKYKPNERIVKKLEFALGISLTEQAD